MWGQARSATISDVGWPVVGLGFQVRAYWAGMAHVCVGPVGKSAAIPVCRKTRLRKGPLPAYWEGEGLEGGAMGLGGAASGEEGGESRQGGVLGVHVHSRTVASQRALFQMHCTILKNPVKIPSWK